MGVRVSTVQGDLEGIDNRYHHAFLGVPFARAPVGEYRYRPPAPALVWKGVRSATEFAPSCPQGYHPIPGMAASGPRDEDCLYLNIYTPRADGGSRPVLYWIHGGGFQMGSGSELLYDGGHLAERGDVVVVTVHYRLGALGFACFGEYARAEGWCPNLGLLDQVEGLKWVQRNIPPFGGDPRNVTIFGESAGASSVATLLAMPSAKGLYHKAILQSGAAARVSAPADAEKNGEALLGELGLTPDTFGKIKEVPVDEIIEAQTRINGRAAGMGAFTPVCDGEVLPEPPHDAVRDGACSSIPLIVGTNRDEAKLFNAVPNRPPVTDDELVRRVSALIESSRADAESIIGLFRDSRREHGLPAENHDVLDLVQSVVTFRVPATRLAEYQSRHQRNTFVYLFTWESPARRGELGSCHALEMPFVFGTLDAPTQDRFAGRGPDAEHLAENMMDAWIAFARTGNPTHSHIGNWRAYEHQRRSTMIFDRKSSVEDDPFREERAAIERLI